MKKILFLLVIALLSGCGKKDLPDINKGKLDPNAMITIKPAKGVKLRSTITGLTALEVVQRANSIMFQTQYLDDVDVGGYRNVSRGVSEELMKDYNIPAIKMLGIDVINAQGEYIRDFTRAKSVYVVKHISNDNIDTLAYVPDEVINTARPLIEAAFADENYTEVYRLFNEAFTFIPIE